MSEITTIYLISQLITVLYYGLFAWSYLLKSQKSIIIVGLLGVILNAAAYILLGAWTGVMMCVIAIIRNLIRYHAEVTDSKFGTSNFFFILILLAIVGVTIPFYDGWLSLMSVFATAIYSYSIWQKNPTVYKICGLPVGILWIIYNLYIGSVFGWILETGLLVFAIVGLILTRRQKRLHSLD